ncbi:MAG: hypothetical protein QXP53_02005 [Candidatus Pacearchaeota archaeon]
MNRKVLILLLILFVISTAFFIFQHSRDLGWDFSVYVLNAKYLFSGGFYFEWLRAPLVPLIIGILSFVAFGSYLVAEYLYIALVSFLFFFASVTLAKKLRINLLIFYGLLLSPFLLLVGLTAGTELLYLTFLMFAINFTLSDKKNSAIFLGIFVGLAFLTHYTSLVFMFLFFVRRPWLKRTFTSLVSFIIIISPWFLYNFLATGSLLTSIADSYAQNIYFRDYLFMPFSLSHFLQAFSYYYLAFFIPGIFICFKNLKNKKIDYFPLLLMSIFFLLVLYFYSRIPLKNPRYLFLLTLPITFFSTSFFEKLEKKLNRRAIIIILVTIILANFLFSIFVLFSYISPFSNRLEYKNVLMNIEKDCMYSSDKWVYLNYFGIVAEPMPWNKEELLQALGKGKRFVIFGSAEPEYLNDRPFLETLPTIKKLLITQLLVMKVCALNLTK